MRAKPIRKHIDLICISVIFVAITIVLSIFKKDFLLYNFFVFEGKNNNFLQLISSSIITQFVHLEFLHLLSNIVFAFYINKEASKYISSKRKIVVAIVGGISVACSLIIFAQVGIEYVGASGWLGAVMGATLVASIISQGNKITSDNKDLVYMSLLFVILSVIVPTISILMHVSGFLSGVLIQFICEYIKLRKVK